MNTHSLYNDLMKLCASNEAFYFVDHVFNGDTYRVFSYRLASYSDFLLPGALECRGHTFRLNQSHVDTADYKYLPELVSLPMEKFFNVGENPMTMDLDWSTFAFAEDKRDGSLISTVKTDHGFILKSKTSLSSQQALAAGRLMLSPKYAELHKAVLRLVSQGFTVNMEYTAPDNQIVLGYKEAELRVLNVRENSTGLYAPLAKTTIPNEFWVDVYYPEVNEDWIAKARTEVGIEGYVLWFVGGFKAKLKTDWYSNLHLQKEQVSNPRRLFESVLMEQSDDLKTLFLEDPQSIARIEEMEVKAKGLYNRLHKLLDDFYQTNKDLSRKDYAILGQQELKADGVFSQAMNLFLGKDMGLKEHMIKNYKSYGIVDTSVTE